MGRPQKSRECKGMELSVNANGKTHLQKQNSITITIPTTATTTTIITKSHVEEPEE